MFCSVPVQTKLYEDDVHIELLIQRQVVFLSVKTDPKHWNNKITKYKKMTTNSLQKILNGFPFSQTVKV